MNKVTEVQKTLKWKMKDSYCANRIGLSLKEYKEIKADILRIRDTVKTYRKGINDFHEAVEEHLNRQVKLEEDTINKTATLQYTGPKEIKTQEDLVRECDIDLDKWVITKMVHNAWGKENNQSYQVKAWLSIKENSVPDSIGKILSEFKFKYIPKDPKYLNTNFTAPTCAVLSLQDIHVGKEILDKGTKAIEKSVQDCVESLVYRSYHSNNIEKIIFVLGGDLLNMDTYLGTTTSGTPVENSISAYEAYQIAFDLMFWCVNFLRQHCKELEVVYIPGNHSRLTEAHVAYSLSKTIVSEDIKWNVEYSERKVITYGNSMICLEHGDFNIQRSFYVFATEFAKEWGSSKYRICYTGHTHKERKIDYKTTDELNGFTLKTLPSLSNIDKYHKEGKWTENKRGGIIDLFSLDSGPTGQFSYFE